MNAQRIRTIVALFAVGAALTATTAANAARMPSGGMKPLPPVEQVASFGDPTTP